MHILLWRVLAGVCLVIACQSAATTQQILTNAEVKELYKMAKQAYSVDMGGLDGAVFLRPGSCSSCLGSLKTALSNSTKTKLVIFVCGNYRFDLPSIASKTKKLVRDPWCSTDALSFAKPLSYLVIRKRAERKYRLFIVEPSTVNEIRSIVR
jgi:hypothetical protein